MRLYEKLGLFEEALGGMEEIIGDQIDEIAKNHLLHQLSEDQIDRLIAQSEHAIQNVRAEDQLDEKSSQLVAQFLSNQSMKPVNLVDILSRMISKTYFDTFLKKIINKVVLIVLIQISICLNWELDARAVVDLHESWNKERLSFPTALMDQQRSSQTEYIFSNRIFKNHGNVEYLNQFHPVMKII
jgi:hypothetical protein